MAPAVTIDRQTTKLFGYASFLRILNRKYTRATDARILNIYRNSFPPNSIPNAMPGFSMKYSSAQLVKDIDSPRRNDVFTQILITWSAIIIARTIIAAKVPLEIFFFCINEVYFFFKLSCCLPSMLRVA